MFRLDALTILRFHEDDWEQCRFISCIGGRGGVVDLHVLHVPVELVSKDDEIIFKGEAYSYFCD